VIGRSFDVELLAQLVEISEARLLDELEAAVQAALLRESTDQVGRRTVHVRARADQPHALSGARGDSPRAAAPPSSRGHRAAARRDSDEHLGELALHWRLATVSVDRPRAAGYSLRAGQRALDNLAPSEAAKLFGEARDMLGSVPSAARSEALIGLGDAQRQTGVPGYRETLLEAAGIAAELRDADLAGRAALANNRGFVSSFGGIDLERVAAIDRAREHASRALELSRDHGYGAFEPRAAAIVASHAAIEP
jgi:hypothetical protein